MGGKMKILFIGNSFSQDANRYLYSLCEAGGHGEVELLNMYIGGCSFEMHAERIRENKADYMVEYNGRDYFHTLYSTLDNALKFREWDYVSIQQVSGDSGFYETYHPYCDELVAHIRKICPGAEILLHRTWGYEHGSNHFAFVRYECSPTLMCERIGEAYGRLKKDVGARAIIPVGEVIEALRALPEFDIRVGGASLHRDGFHLGEGYGRFAAAAVWYQAMGIGEIAENPFTPTVEGEDDPALYALIRRTVSALVHPLV